MLQGLEAADGHAELFATLRILNGLVGECLHNTDGLSAYGKCRLVHDRIEYRVGLIYITENGVRLDAYILQDYLSRLVAINRWIGISRHTVGHATYGEQCDAVTVCS